MYFWFKIIVNSVKVPSAEPTMLNAICTIQSYKGISFQKLIFNNLGVLGSKSPGVIQKRYLCDSNKQIFRFKRTSWLIRLLIVNWVCLFNMTALRHHTNVLGLPYQRSRSSTKLAGEPSNYCFWIVKFARLNHTSSVWITLLAFESRIIAVSVYANRGFSKRW